MYVRASGTNISPCADTFSRQAWKRKRSGEGGETQTSSTDSLLQDGQNTDREKTEGNKPPSDQMTRTRPTRSTRADRPRHRGMHDTCASCCNMHGQKTYIKTTCCFSYLTPTAKHFFCANYKIYRRRRVHARARARGGAFPPPICPERLPGGEAVWTFNNT